MIVVKRLNGKEFVVNAELILYIEETPDTIITLTSGQKVVVENSLDEVIEKVIEYKWKTYNYYDKSKIYGKEV